MLKFWRICFRFICRWMHGCQFCCRYRKPCFYTDKLVEACIHGMRLNYIKHVYRMVKINDSDDDNDINDDDDDDDDTLNRCVKILNENNIMLKLFNINKLV